VTPGYRYCHVCYGRGIISTPDGKQWQICPICKGTGRVPIDWRDLRTITARTEW